VFIHRPDFNGRIRMLALLLVRRGLKLFFSAERSSSLPLQDGAAVAAGSNSRWRSERPTRADHGQLGPHEGTEHLGK
jgi:hypothetical protein